MLKNIRRDVLLIILASICWISLTIFTLQLTAPGWNDLLNKFFHAEEILVKNIFLSTFFLFTYLFFKDFQSKNKNTKNSQVEWIVISINLVCLVLHLVILWLEHYAEPLNNLAIWLNFLNNFNILIGTIFSANCFFYFKRLILFQKNYHVNLSWKIFEIMIFSSILLTIFNVDINDPLIATGLSIYAAFALILSTQMRWVAFLSKQNKLKTIGYFLLFFVLLCLIVQNFFFESFTFGQDANNLLVIDCAHKFFLLSTFTFVLFYIISSILILLFHLPTSSVFEQKQTINENFKKLSQTITNNKTKDEILQILLDSAISTSEAFCGWICDNDINLIANFEINKKNFKEVNTFLVANSNGQAKNPFILTRVHRNKTRTPFLVEHNIKSILITPILINHVEIGKLVVMKRIEDTFDGETIEIIQSYATQAAVSIENISLFSKALENERYQEEINIAKRVKNKLLLQNFDLSQEIEASLFSSNSDHIGGDYYDFYKFSDTYLVFVLGDVSGNGTSAAFNMAQLKGTFQTAARTIKKEEDFPVIFNDVLNVCLENNSFVSLSFFFVNTENKEITHFRCGHLPSIYIHNQEVKHIYPKGIGLGMVEKEHFTALTEKFTFKYSSGDFLFCHTDGLSETANKSKHYFGTDKVIQIILNNSSFTAQEIINQVKVEFKIFTESNEVLDDVTCICLKFK